MVAPLRMQHEIAHTQLHLAERLNHRIWRKLTSLLTGSHQEEKTAQAILLIKREKILSFPHKTT